ncbi:hypothetical protein L0Y65_01075 [Candidatus Micrarchaeota archaeon]|nr:hypothetical protein [Candidatus Micrarchaeota archaeon]
MKGLLAILVIALIVGHGCTGQGQQPPPGGNNTGGNATLTQAMCDAANGHWNECGSACRGAPEGTACILMCVQYCECGGIAGFGCPAGYECTDYLPSEDTPDAMGICKKISESGK